MNDLSESGKQETIEATTEISLSPAETVSQVLSQSLVQATCPCSRAPLPQEASTRPLIRPATGHQAH